jgi:hypothetical protein
MNKSETITLPQKRGAESSLSSLANIKRVKVPKTKSKANKSRCSPLPSDLYTEFELKPRNQVPYLREVHNLLLWVLSDSEGSMPKWIFVPVFYNAVQTPHLSHSSHLPPWSGLPRRPRPRPSQSFALLFPRQA